MVEVVGCPWDSLWNYGIKGKLMAPYLTLSMKAQVKNAPFAIYVTNEFLQNRYPTDGISTNCSNVEISDVSKEVLEKRLQHIKNNDDKFIIGTTAAVNVPYKGHQYVIEALAKLKKEGIHKFEYQMVGFGDQTRLKAIIKENDVEDRVKFMGSMTHEQVFEWLDTIDIYVQPSRQEGLPRALIEAMSRACPIIASSAGGNYELTDIIFKKGNIKQIKQKLKSIDKNFLITESKQSFNKAQKYSKENLDRKRNGFYIKFIKGEKNENE